MIPLPAFVPVLIAAAVGAAGGYALASKVGAVATAKAEQRRIECEHAREQDARAAAERTADLLARAQGAEARAAAGLAAAQAAADHKLKETRHDIHRLASGRDCLSGALRLRLNAGIAAGDLPQGAAAADPAAPAAASDTAVAGWILDAARLYEACRARIDAIHEWDAMTYGVHGSQVEGGAHGR